MTDSLEREVRELRSFYWSERDPDGRGFAPLADAYRRSGDLEEASELLAEGLDRHPDFASGHVVAARVHLAEGNKEAAVDALDRVLELDDENTEALWTLGSLREERGEGAAALELFKRLAVLVPDDDEVLDRMRALQSELASGGDGESGLDEGLVGETVDSADWDDGASDRGAEATLDVPGSGGSEGLGREELDFGTVDATTAEVPTEEELYTRTLAELYADQGLFDRAADVYRLLIEADPEDTELRARLEAVEGRTLPATPGGEASGEEAVDATDLDELASELAAGPLVAEDLDTPFAWSEMEPPSEPDTEGPPIADHLSDLLSWPAPEVAGAPDEEAAVPGAGTVEEAEPASEPVSIDSLAPEDSPTAAEAVGAEEPVPVAFLAPDAAENEVVPIEALAPEEARPVEGEEEEVSDQVAKFRDWMRRLGK